MSVQDPIVYPAKTYSEDIAGSGFWFRLAIGTAFCVLAVFAWVSGAANAAQIIAAIAVLSIGLSARAVMKIDEIDENGMDEKPSAIETATGVAVFSGLTALALIAASSLFAPLGGPIQFAVFVLAFAAALSVVIVTEGILSAVACILLKPVLAKSAVGAEIAVMLNLQQKFRMRLA